MWPRYYVAPSWHTPTTRDEKRREIKVHRRRLRIQDKALALFDNCSVSIVVEGKLSEEDEIDLMNIFNGLVFAEYDYYPIPKVIHNKLRRYIHEHPHVGDISLKNYLVMKWNETLIVNTPSVTFARRLDGITGITELGPYSF